MAGQIPADVQDAFYRVTHDYAGGEAKGGGVPALARKMGMPVGTLYNKANVNETSHHKPTLADAVLAQVISGDHRILHAMANTLGEVCFPLPDLSQASDEALLELMNNIGAEGGDLYRAVNEGLSDRRYTRREHDKVRAEAYQFIAAICEVVARLEGLIDE